MFAPPWGCPAKLGQLMGAVKRPGRAVMQKGAHQGPLISLIVVEYFSSDNCVFFSFSVKAGRQLIIPFSFSRESFQPSL